jgi:hypothetical protein
VYGRGINYKGVQMKEKEQIKTVKKYKFLSYLKHGLLQLPLLPGNPL